MLKQIFNLVVIVSLVGCITPLKTKSVLNPAKKTLVFVHGSHFDGSVWQKIVTELSPYYNIVTPDLPGRADKDNATLVDMAQNLCSKVAAPSIFVAHSTGGAVVNQMLNICSPKILQIVYVSAFVPLNGEKPFDALSAQHENLYKQLVDFKTNRIYPKHDSFIRGMDKNITDESAFSTPLHSESYASSANALKFQESIFERIPKAYIYSERDNVIPLETQIKFTSRTTMQKTASLTSGHLPMLSRPKSLSKALRQIVQ